MDSIRNYVLHGKEASDEPIMGRIMDARNYLLLLGGIIYEGCGSLTDDDCRPVLDR